MPFPRNIPLLSKVNLFDVGVWGWSKRKFLRLFVGTLSWKCVHDIRRKAMTVFTNLNHKVFYIFLVTWFLIFLIWYIVGTLHLILPNLQSWAYFLYWLVIRFLVSLINPYSPMMDFFYKILLSEKAFNKMNIFGFIFEKKIKFGPKIPKFLFASLNWR